MWIISLLLITPLLCRDNQPVAVPENINNLFQEVITDLESQLAKRFFVRPFMTSEFDTFNAGATYNLQGAIVGIPATFMYTTLDDVDKNKIKVWVILSLPLIK